MPSVAARFDSSDDRFYFRLMCKFFFRVPPPSLPPCCVFLAEKHAEVKQIALSLCAALRLRCLSVLGSDGPFQQFVTVASAPAAPARGTRTHTHSLTHSLTGLLEHRALCCSQRGHDGVQRPWQQPSAWRNKQPP